MPSFQRARAGALLAPALVLSLLAGPSARASASFPCSAGVELRLDSSLPAQGQLLSVIVRAEEPLTFVRAAWGGQELHFWRDARGQTQSTYQALLGVDLARKPRSYVLAVSATTASGKRVACGVPFSVQRGSFVVERLNVDYRYVELSREDLERARRESRKLRKIFRTVTPEKLWEGPFHLPLPGVEGSGNFGKRRIFNGQPRSPHSGEDFPAPAGTPIRASQRGRVVLAEEHFFSGNTVVIDHGLGLYTFYGHLQSIGVEAGQMVQGGTVLGRVGATGRVTGPHLHWTVRLGSSRVNPRDLLKLPG